MYGVRSTGLGNDVRAAEDEGCEEADHDRRGRRDDLAGRVLAPADGENRRGAEGNGTSWICGMFHVLGLNSAGAEQVVVTDSVASPEPRILMSAGVCAWSSRPPRRRSNASAGPVRTPSASAGDPHTQIAAGLEQLVILTRMTFSSCGHHCLTPMRRLPGGQRVGRGGSGRCVWEGRQPDQATQNSLPSGSAITTWCPVNSRSVAAPTASSRVTSTMTRDQRCSGVPSPDTRRSR